MMVKVLSRLVRRFSAELLGLCCPSHLLQSFFPNTLSLIFPSCKWLHIWPGVSVSSRSKPLQFCFQSSTFLNSTAPFESADRRAHCRKRCMPCTSTGVGSSLKARQDDVAPFETFSHARRTMVWIKNPPWAFILSSMVVDGCTLPET